MKQLLHIIPSCMRDSKALVQEIRDLHLSKNAKLFTPDATEMYTNIETTIGAQAIPDLLETHNISIPPKEFFLLVLENHYEQYHFQLW